VKVLKRSLQIIGIGLLLGFTWLNIDYWRDPPFWRRWWDTVTHLQPDHMNFSPTVGLQSSRPVALPVADAAARDVSSEALRAAENYAAEFDSFSLVVVHAGKIQTEWYAEDWHQERLSQSQSMNKTVTALMMGVAIADGHVASTDDAVDQYLAEWQDDPRGKITIENLLVMSSGLAQYRFTLNPFARDTSFRFLFSRDRAPVVLGTSLQWEPGSRFDYNDINAQLTGMLVERASGRDYADYVAEKLWEPLGAGYAELWLDRENGLAMTACCLLASAVDWARIGLLMKDGGRINGRQVVSADWIERMISPSPRFAGYGYLTWLGEGSKDVDLEEFPAAYQSEPFLARDLFMLQGYGGQRVYVSRDKDLVIVRLGPFSGMQPLKPGWDNAYLVNTVIRGLR
jgi:CubicO group peptidase (beta-lactamase class C family)